MPGNLESQSEDLLRMRRIEEGLVLSMPKQQLDESPGLKAAAVTKEELLSFRNETDEACQELGRLAPLPSQGGLPLLEVLVRALEHRSVVGSVKAICRGAVGKFLLAPRA